MKEKVEQFIASMDYSKQNPGTDKTENEWWNLYDQYRHNHMRANTCS